MENNAQRFMVQLQGNVSVLDFSYICSLFLVANNETNLHHRNIQKWKYQNLLKIFLKTIFSRSQNPERVMFNFCCYELTDKKKNI